MYVMIQYKSKKDIVSRKTEREVIYMFTLGEFASTYSDKTELITIVAEESKREISARAYFFTKFLYGVLYISTVNGTNVTVRENDFCAITNYLGV